MPLLDSEQILSLDQSSFAHAYKISKPYGQIESMLLWARETLEQEWRWQLIECSSSYQHGLYIFYFDSEKDYMTFVLKWS